MAQEETLLLKRGQPYLETDIRPFLKMLANENLQLLCLFLKYVRMYPQIKSRNIDVSYFPNDIFVRGHALAPLRKEPNDFFRHQLKKISGEIKVHATQEDATISFLVFLEKPNWEIEEQIYNAYGDLLDQFPDDTFSLELIELFGKRPKNYIS